MTPNVPGKTCNWEALTFFCSDTLSSFRNRRTNCEPYDYQALPTICSLAELVWRKAVAISYAAPLSEAAAYEFRVVGH